MYRGYIKSWRKVLTSPMFQSLNAVQRDVFWILLHLANHDNREWMWKGEMLACEPGQFITSLESIKQLCAKKTTVQNIRTALKLLKKWEFLTNESTKAGRLISIVNWVAYQDSENKTNKHITDDQQRANKDLTPNKNVRSKNKEKTGASAPPSNGVPYQKIITYLNDKAHKQFKHNAKNTQQFIKARWNEGFRYEDFQRVIDTKSSKWLSNPDMVDYLRPQTLFGTKFESYLNEEPQHSTEEEVFLN